jgi:hypothetical protein
MALVLGLRGLAGAADFVGVRALRDCYLGATAGFSSFHRPLLRELPLLE